MQKIQGISRLSKIKSFLSKLPSFVWVILFPLGIILFIGFIIILFYLMSHFEGFVSILMIISFFISAKFVKIDFPKKETFKGFWLAAGILFFAVMGMALDQTGNVLYNKPLEMLFCPRETQLARDVYVRNPLPERTDYVQRFDCVDGSNQVVYSINMFQIISVRFVEYIIIAYILLAILKSADYLLKIRKRK